MGAFADQIRGWTNKSEDHLTAIYRRSVRLLANEMSRTKKQGGLVPVLTTNLSKSLVASTEGMPKTSLTRPAGSDVGVVIATLKLDQTIWLGYTAIYARRQNYGYVGADKLGRVFNQQGSYFVEGAIEKWPQIVAQAAKEIQGAVEGRQ